MCRAVQGETGLAVTADATQEKPRSHVRDRPARRILPALGRALDRLAVLTTVIGARFHARGGPVKAGCRNRFAP